MSSNMLSSWRCRSSRIHTPNKVCNRKRISQLCTLEGALGHPHSDHGQGRCRARALQMRQTEVLSGVHHNRRARGIGPRRRRRGQSAQAALQHAPLAFLLRLHTLFGVWILLDPEMWINWHSASEHSGRDAMMARFCDQILAQFLGYSYSNHSRATQRP